MSFKRFESIFYPAFDSYDLTEWKLEKMPEHVKIDRKSMKRAKSDGWFFRSHNARSKFCCPKCDHKKKANDESVWSSVYTTLLFRARYWEEKDTDGIIWGYGRVQMKIFEQGCQTCETYSTGHLDEDGIKFAFYWLHIWLLKTFYYVEIYEDDDDHDQPQNEELGRGPHDSKRCKACHKGWCKYRQQKKLNSKRIQSKRN